jgi:hypothetical protein
MGLAGTWIVISSHDFNDDYLYMDGQPYVRLETHGRTTGGDYHIGLQTGTINGGSDDNDQLSFDFVGNDEMEPMQGTGTGASISWGGHPERAHRTARSPSRAAGAADA